MNPSFLPAVPGPSPATCLKAWLALVLLTGLLAGLSRIGPGFAVAGLLTITPLKAGLVLRVFMRLGQEEPLLRLVVLVGLTTLAVFFALLFADAAWR